MSAEGPIVDVTLSPDARDIRQIVTMISLSTVPDIVFLKDSPV
jgi:hypothetical protein